MYELNGQYKSEIFFLEIIDNKFSLFNLEKQIICSGFIIYISSDVLKNKKTKLALTSRQMNCPVTNLESGLIDSIYYQNNIITLTYSDHNKDIVSTQLQKID
jgi:hypothetical protein